MRCEDATLRAAVDCMHSTAMQVLVPRKLYIMSSKTSFYPRTVISLLDANPRLAVHAYVHLASSCEIAATCP